MYAFERILLPILADYAPELTIISCGFDAAVKNLFLNKKMFLI